MKVQINAGEYLDLVNALTLADGETVYVEYSGNTIRNNSAWLLMTTDTLATADPESGAFVSADEYSVRAVRGVTKAAGNNIGLYNTGERDCFFSIYKG